MHIEETRRTDPELAALVDEELARQEACIEMIASESIVPIPVMEMSGSIFTNKTLEGLPGARYQAGAEIADKLERLAWERAKALFGAEHVNIQSYPQTIRSLRRSSSPATRSFPCGSTRAAI